MSKRLPALAAVMLAFSLDGGVAQPVARTTSLPPSAVVSPDVFNSVALPVRNSRYSARWTRVVRTSSPFLPALVQPARAFGRTQKAIFVNALLNHRIGYRFDSKPSGDHWATVQETLTSSSGDCEDFVIAKMQALRALGVPSEDLYMTIGNDVSAGAVHAILLVRSGSQFLVLDNRADRLIPQEQYRDFYPILSFSGNRTWLHGYRRGTMPDAVRAMQVTTLASTGKLPLGNSQSSARQIASSR